MNTMRAILIGAAVISTVSFAVAQTAPGTHGNGASRPADETALAYLDQNIPANTDSSDRLNDPKWVAAHLSADDFHF